MFYRGGGDAKFTSVQMKPRYNELVGRIPAKIMAGSSVQYYLEVRNAQGEMITRVGRPASPNIVYIDPKARPRYYPDLTDDRDWVDDNGGGGGGGGSIFEEFFGGGGGGGRRRQGMKRSGSDLRYDLNISLEEAAQGTEKELELEKFVACDKCHSTGAKGKAAGRACGTCGGSGQVVTSRGFFHIQQPCPTCAGAGEVIADPCSACRGEGRVQGVTRVKMRIPPGAIDGVRLRSTANGDAGQRGGEAGDLYLVIHVKRHEIFERDHNDLHCTVPVPFSLAALGGDLVVPTLEGKATVKIPGGTQSETVFRLRHKGMPEINSSRKGDLLVTIQVEVPTKLTKDQEEKLRAFAESINHENSPLRESFFEKAKRFFK